MEFEELRIHVGNELKRRFWEHKAMPALSRGRARMDGWLKIELAAILSEKFADAQPAWKLPKGRAAARAGGWIVEAASLPTDFACDDTKPGPGSLADDVRDLRRTIKRLRKGRGPDRAAVFLAVYPFGDLHEARWAPHKSRIEKALGGPLSEDRFSFQSGVAGRLCAGVVADKVKTQPTGRVETPGKAERTARRPAGRAPRAAVVG